MLTQTTITYLLGLSALGSIGVTIYNSLKKPQEKSAITDAVFDIKFRDLEKVVINLRDNHIHTLDNKLDGHIKENQMKSIEDAKWQGRVEVLLENIARK